MRYTEKWAYGKQEWVYANTYEKTVRGLTRVQTYIDNKWNTWMLDYRNKIQAIDTDEKASQAIRQYWHEVAKEWDNGKGIIH